MTNEKRKKCALKGFVIFLIGIIIYYLIGLELLLFYVLVILSLIFAVTKNLEDNFEEKVDNFLKRKEFQKCSYDEAVKLYGSKENFEKAIQEDLMEDLKRGMKYSNASPKEKEEMIKNTTNYFKN